MLQKYEDLLLKNNMFLGLVCLGFNIMSFSSIGVFLTTSCLLFTSKCKLTSHPAAAIEMLAC